MSNITLLDQHDFPNFALLTRGEANSGGKKPHIYSEREAAATWLLTRCGPELRRYTEKPGGVEDVLFFSDVFFVTWSQDCGSLCETIEAVK